MKRKRIRETSIRAYESIKATLGNRQLAVYDVIRDKGPICNFDIAREMFVSIDRVTPRTTELVTAGVVVEAYKAKCEATNRTVLHWKAKQ